LFLGLRPLSSDSLLPNAVILRRRLGRGFRPTAHLKINADLGRFGGLIKMWSKEERGSSSIESEDLR
jgi:hypothetical protein